ncbi:MAG: type II toxin-antitoxin system RelE/ParE family toxin [Gammaproteobacteria bacterium]|nr:type II toxin-antitoxin system RelE/ParE family toxin [Gammaproteobacteria bacterium]
MTRYLFYSTADKQQDGIWHYTFETWGEAQAEKYIRELHQHLDKLTETKMLWHPLPSSFMPVLAQKVPIYFSRYQHHYIFFRELSNGDLGIMSILHESMDMPIRLQEDLQYIKDKTK